jgi:hypothetical protein
MGDSDRTWWPFAVPAVLAVGLVSLTFAFGSSGSRQPALACPKSIPTSTDRPWVPHTTDAVDTENRLAPDLVPTNVVVCSYAGDRKGPQPPRKPLTGSKELSGKFDSMVDTIAYLPHKIASQAAHCPARFANEDDGYYLLGLTYLDGVEWINTVENLCSPTPTTNGSYDSSALLATDLRRAYQSGSWPTPETSGKCVARGIGRTGQETSLVPDGYSSLDVCKMIDVDVVAEAHPDDGETHDVVAALNALPTGPMTSPGGCGGWYASGDDDVGYRLVFHYPVGADAVVNVETSKNCDPPISNGSLQSSDLTSVVPRLEHLTS